MLGCLHALPAHIGEQTGAKFFLEILHHSQSFTEIKGSVTSGVAFGMSAVNELFNFAIRFTLRRNSLPSTSPLSYSCVRIFKYGFSELRASPARPQLPWPPSPFPIAWARAFAFESQTTDRCASILRASD
jgi:hypothetical protein